MNRSVQTYKRTFPVACLLIGFCLEIFFIKQPYIQLNFQIYPNDLIYSLVFLSVIVGFIYRPLPITEAPFVLWLAFGGTIFSSLILGLSEYGKYAGTEFRPFFYLWAAGLYCCAADFSESDLLRIGRWCLLTAYTLIGIAICFWVGVESGLIDRMMFGEIGGGGAFRPVGSHAAFFVAAIALIQTMAWLRGTGTRQSGWHAATFFLFVTVIQHRSVWIAALIGLLCVMFLERRDVPKRLPLLIGFLTVISLLASLAFGLGYLDELLRTMTRSALSMTDRQGTFAARVDGWDRLVDSWMESSTQSIMFGFPFGRGYARLYNGQFIEFAPHNFYVDLMLRVGVVGLLLFLLTTCLAIWHSFRAQYFSEFEYLLTRGIGVGLIASLFYYIAYPSYHILGAATGVALAQIIRQRRLRTVQSQDLIRSLRRPLVRRAAK